MPGCFITSCKSRNEKGFTLHRIPKIPERRAKWLEAVAARQGRQGRHRLPRLCQRYKFIQVKIY
jgi:hypothetical protein